MVELKDEEMFTNQYWRINKKMLKIAGLWPYQSTRVKVIIRTFILVAIHTMMIPQMIRTYYEWGKNVEIVLENITGFFYFQAIICKYITIFLFEDKLLSLYATISADWRDWHDSEERKVLARHANYGRFLTIGYTVYLYTAGIGFATLPALIPTFLDLLMPQNVTRKKFLCFYGEYFIDEQAHYYELLLHTFFCVMCTILLYTAIDSTYACSVQHIVGMFHIVQYRLGKAFELVRDRDSYKSIELDEKVHSYVISAIKLHQKSIGFVDFLQETYTTCFFITTGVVLLALSLGTVDLMLSIGNIANFTRLTFAFCGVVLHLFYISMPGQRIIDSSSSIFNSVYFSGWYAFPIESQHSIRFMMMRSLQPCEFTAGPLLVMNLQNCGVVLKSAMSYCTFMIAMT